MPNLPSGIDPASLPEHWSPAALDAVAGILAEHPDLSASDLAALTQAAELISYADEAADIARKAGNTAQGSMGQLTVHPLAAEARQARASAATIVARIDKRPLTGAERTARARLKQQARMAR
jgi:hypothetical protein